MIDFWAMPKKNNRVEAKQLALQRQESRTASSQSAKFESHLKEESNNKQKSTDELHRKSNNNGSSRDLASVEQEKTKVKQKDRQTSKDSASEKNKDTETKEIVKEIEKNQDEANNLYLLSPITNDLSQVISTDDIEEILDPEEQKTEIVKEMVVNQLFISDVDEEENLEEIKVLPQMLLNDNKNDKEQKTENSRVESASSEKNNIPDSTISPKEESKNLGSEQKTRQGSELAEVKTKKDTNDAKETRLFLDQKQESNPDLKKIMDFENQRTQLTRLNQSEKLEIPIATKEISEETPLVNKTKSEEIPLISNARSEEMPNTSLISSQRIESEEKSQSILRANHEPRVFVDPKSIIEQIVKKAELLIRENNSEMKIQLKPEHLGKMMIKVVMDNGVLTARFITENQHVKQLLESNMHTLRQNLEASGIRVERTEVSVQTNNSNQFGDQGENKGSPYQGDSTNFKGQAYNSEGESYEELILANIEDQLEAYEGDLYLIGMEKTSVNYIA